MDDTMKPPADYPSTANSGIYDARAFTIGDNLTMHTPARFPDGNKVTALCGAYAWATERETRLAYWASGYDPAQTECAACVANGGAK